MLLLFLVGRRDGVATRRRIKRCIRAHPGLSKNGVAKKLGLHWNAVRHHIDVLEEEGEVVVEDRGWNHELFSPEVPLTHRRLVSAFRHPDRSMLLDALLACPMIGTYELSSELAWSRKKVLAHLAHLQEAGLVERVGHARPRYRPVELPEDLDALVQSLGFTEPGATGLEP